jgi:hypothetical protein
MATIVNDRDVLLQAAGSRYVDPVWSLRGLSDIDILGGARISGQKTAVNFLGFVASVVANDSFGADYGVIALTDNTGGAGLVGYSDIAGARGSYAGNISGGTALDVDGKMVTNNSTLVTNLNADLVDGYHASALIAAGPNDFVVSFSGVPTASQILLKLTVTRAFTLGANLSGTKSTAADVAATASTVVEIKKNGTQVATLTYAAAGTVPTLATSGGTSVSFAVDDILLVICPATPDATLSGIYAFVKADR